MDEKELRTSPKQRFFIILIAVLMLGSIIASYAAIVINGGKSSTSTGSEGTISEEKIAEYEADYEAKLAEFQATTKNDYDTLVGYKKEVAAFNETSANENGVKSRDLKIGDGRELGEYDENYLAFYIGFCPNETIFDSSFDSNSNPTNFKATGLLDLTQMSLIEGWYIGMKGARAGGVREITIPSDLAYGSQELDGCDGANKPLKFIVLVKDYDADLAKMSDDLQEAFLKYQYAIYYGIDYDNVVQNVE